MKKICLIIHSLGIGGMERVLSLLANNFAKKDDVQVHLVLIGISREINYPLDSSVNIHRPNFKFSNKRRSIGTIRTILFLRQKVKQINPDSLLSFGEFWNNLVLLSLLGLPYPVFISDRSEPNKDLGKLHNSLRRLLYPKAEGYIAQTEQAKKVCLNKGWNNNVCVIGNPIREIEPDKKIAKENIVLSVGRLIKTKHFDQLIRMFAEIDKPGWKLVIVGGDAKKLNLSEELKTLIHDLGVEDSVFLEGEQRNIDTYYNKSKIFAFTSSSEGFPNVIGEALSAGLAVISYDCVAGPGDMINDGENGFLIPLFSQKKFIDKLSNLMDSNELRNKFRSNARLVIKSYDTETIADKFFRFILPFQPTVKIDV